MVPKKGGDKPRPYEEEGGDKPRAYEDKGGDKPRPYEMKSGDKPRPYVTNCARVGDKARPSEGHGAPS